MHQEYTRKDDGRAGLPAPTPASRRVRIPAGIWQVGMAVLGLLLGGLLIAAVLAWDPPGSVEAARPHVSVTVTVIVLGAPPTATKPPPPTGTPVPRETAQAVRTETAAGSQTMVTFSGPVTSVVGLAWAPDNRTLALAGNDK